MADGTPAAVITEDLLLPGWDPGEPVPATVYRPEAREKLPVVFALHGFGGSREQSARLLPRLAGAGFLAVAIDGFLHGRRREPSVFVRNLADLAEDFAIWVHQTCVSHTARDVSRMIDSLGDLPQADPSRIGVTGVSMGGCSAWVLACREPRISAAVSMIGAADFWWDVTKIAPGPEQEAWRRHLSPRLRQLVDSLDPMQHMEGIFPKPVLLLNGGQDHWIDPRSVKEFARRLRARYYDRCPENIACLVEPQIGHKVTDLMWNRMTAWFTRHLQGELAGME
ncbi:MAG: alpha/beta hydrolase family protein [Planctomycetota bacterium]|jgi:dienelactone hydrolase